MMRYEAEIRPLPTRQRADTLHFMSAIVED